jgi:hypothetical protein
MRKKRSLDRATGVIRDANLIVIASEDTYAVRQYFDFFRSTRIQFRVLPTDDGRSAPEHVVARIDEYRREYEIGEGDQFWVVLDCDHWVNSGHIKNLVRVMQECRQKAVGIALSNPSFELWLLLHFADFPREKKLTRAQVERLIRAAVGSYDKTKVYRLPLTTDSVKAAVRRSKANEPAADAIPQQPRTGVHRIVEDLLARDVITVD